MALPLPRTITDAARLISKREASPIELVRGLLARIEAVDPVIASFLTVTADEALAQAQAAENEIVKGRYRGALHGIPFGAKDNYETRGIRTTGHSRRYAEHVSHDDAAVVERLYEAGAVLMGKLALHELAHGGPSFDLPWPPARNPWNPEHFTGGSSSGSAAALAAGLALFTLGSDTGGSIRTPASLCGLVGFKPTFGAVSRYGVIPNCWSLDHCGPLTHTVEDCALVMQEIAGHDPRDRSSLAEPVDFRLETQRDLRNVRIGVVRGWSESPSADPELVRSLEDSLHVLEQLGARVEAVQLRPMRDYCDVWTLIEAPETFSIQRRALAERPQDFGAVFLERTLIACLIASSDYVDAQRMRALMMDEIRSVWERYDVLVTAGAGPAPRLDPKLAAWPSINRFSPFALLGVPAIVVPSGYSVSGLPLSIQLVAKPYADAKLLCVAHAYEQATQFGAQRRPQLDGVQPPAPVAGEAPARSTAGMDSRVVDLCDRAAANAGLRLSDSELAILCGAAPYLLDMLERVRGHACEAEPASVFLFPL